jgi:hypothetical protein
MLELDARFVFSDNRPRDAPNVRGTSTAQSARELVPPVDLVNRVRAPYSESGTTAKVLGKTPIDRWGGEA